MTYSNFEQSTEQGTPVELYIFSHGTQTFRYTSTSSDVQFGGHLFTSKHSISRNAVSQDTEDFSGRVELSISRKSEVAKLYVEYLPVAPVNVQILRYHDEDPDKETNFIQVFKGTVLTCKFNQLEAVLKCAPMTSAFKRVIPIHTFQPTCNFTVFSQTTSSIDGTQTWHGCNASQAAHEVNATVLSVDGSTLTVSGIPAHPDNYYQGGVVISDSGETRMVRQQVGGVLTLEHRIASLTPGAIVKLLPGCDGQETTCRNKFNNIRNFSGFSRIPFNNPFTSEFI